MEQTVLTKDKELVLTLMRQKPELAARPGTGTRDFLVIKKPRHHDDGAALAYGLRYIPRYFATAAPPK